MSIGWCRKPALSGQDTLEKWEGGEFENYRDTVNDASRISY